MIDLKSRISCSDWTKAARHLCKIDPALKAVIRRVGACTLAPRRNYFSALCQSIINQQISTAAGRTIFRRFRALFPRLRPTAARLLELDDAALRAAGISRQKMIYLRGLADAFASGRVPVRRIQRMSDEEIIEALTAIKGIGRWTVEMFLIFLLNRPDVLPVADLGVRKSVQTVYGLKELPTASALNELGEPWRPYRTIATWYLWRSG